MKEILINNTKIIFDKNNVKIIDSYKINNELDMLIILCTFRTKALFNYNIEYKRSYKSWIAEWKTHNKLYNKGLFIIHTKDCDLCENESIFRKIIYRILEVF